MMLSQFIQVHQLNNWKIIYSIQRGTDKRELPFEADTNQQEREYI